MKIQCCCGGTIVDSTDYLPNKGHVVPDQVFFDIHDKNDLAIEQCGNTVKEKEMCLMKVRSNFVSRFIWQCNSCDRLYLDNANNELVCFKPESGNSTGILKA